LTDGSKTGEVSFYRHKQNHVLSQFPKPDNITDFEVMLLPSKSVLELISEHGDPYYVKIDIEHYDEVILRMLFENSIMPPFISAESHSIEMFSLLVALGKYNAFKLVDGSSISLIYRNHEIITNQGKEMYSFPNHSAGPFGEDVLGGWMTANNFFRLLGLAGLGWKDIHATNIHPPNPKTTADIQTEVKIVLNNNQ
jgi:hypothetical protein